MYVQEETTSFRNVQVPCSVIGPITFLYVYRPIPSNAFNCLLMSSEWLMIPVITGQIFNRLLRILLHSLHTLESSRRSYLRSDHLYRLQLGGSSHSARIDPKYRRGPLAGSAEVPEAREGYNSPVFGPPLGENLSGSCGISYTTTLMPAGL